MKKLSKLLSLALAILMVMSLVGAAFAEDPSTETTGPAEPAPAEGSTKIIIQNSSAGATYKFFKLMNLTQSSKEVNGETKTTYAYSINSKYFDALKSVTGKDSESGILEYFNGIADKSAQMRTLANSIYAQIKNMADDGTATAAQTGTSYSAKFEGECGYYLIAQSSAASSAEYSLVMVNTGKSGTVVDINAKVDLPRSSKKIIERNDSTDTDTDWQDHADYDVGDAIPFRLRCTVSDNLLAYQGQNEDGTAKKYPIIFHDIASPGLTLVSDAAPGSEFDYFARVYHQGDTDGTLIDKSCYTIVSGAGSTGCTAGCTFHVIFDDIFSLTSGGTPITMHGDEMLAVKFYMRLNDESVIGKAGNPNESWISFKNNPYDDTSKGETPHDKVKVFTYKMIVNKVDDNKEPLTGAQFQLYKMIQNGTDPDDPTKKVYKTEPWGELKSGAVNATTGAVEFTWDRLDAGTYKLVEETVPDGYNKMDDVFFKIDTTFDTNEADPGLDTFTVTVLDSTMQAVDFSQPGNADKYAKMTGNKDNCTVTTTIVNKSGALLPSTGGIGTTMFYVFGSILAIGAGVLLVSKKRMGAAD